MSKKLFIISLLFLTLFSRFVNLNWDRGFGFHPDENNLWGASRQINIFKGQLNPKFYAYGGFPIYLYSLLPNKVAARAVSALCQVLIILLLFLIAKSLTSLNSPKFPKVLPIFCALLGAFSAGLLQAAHFLTVESLIGLFALLEVYFLLSAYKNYNRYKLYNFYLLLAVFSFGLGLATKISFVTFALPFAVLLRPPTPPSASWRTLKSLISHILKLCSVSLIPIFVFIFFNPFIFTSWKDFRSTLLYESAVASSRTPVFYTRQFIGTIPGLFQTLHIFPFIESWIFIPLFLIGCLILTITIIAKGWRCAGSPALSMWHRNVPGCSAPTGPRSAHLIVLLSVIAALLSFLPFYVKWTRYVVQVLPILTIPAALALSALWQKSKFGRLITLISLISLIFPFLSTLKVYLSPDTRLSAAAWAEKNITTNSKIFSESYDLGILPFNPAFQKNITLFNFYELDDEASRLNNPPSRHPEDPELIEGDEGSLPISPKQQELNTLIHESDYFISVSERIYGNSLIHSDKFPASAEFYRQLFSGSLGYQKVYESIGSSVIAKESVILIRQLAEKNLARLAKRAQRYKYFPLPEETFSVFDNPTVIIFKKIR